MICQNHNSFGKYDNMSNKWKWLAEDFHVNIARHLFAGAHQTRCSSCGDNSDDEQIQQKASLETKLEKTMFNTDNYKLIQM